MTARRAISEVARREFVERWRSRAMRISFAILLALVVAGATAARRRTTSASSDRARRHWCRR
jgi:hypothetical protein